MEYAERWVDLNGFSLVALCFVAEMLIQAGGSGALGPFKLLMLGRWRKNEGKLKQREITPDLDRGKTMEGVTTWVCVFEVVCSRVRIRI